MTWARKVTESREQRIEARQKPREPSVLPKMHRGTYAIIGTEINGDKSVPKLRRDDKVRQDIRDSARGEECLMRIDGCKADPAYTIWSHFRGLAGGKGMGTKSVDVAGAYTCTWCDAVYDGQLRVPGLDRATIEAAWFVAHIRSLERLAEKGLL